jgi:hypothetical protein
LSGYNFGGIVREALPVEMIIFGKHIYSGFSGVKNKFISSMPGGKLCKAQGIVGFAI